MNFLPVLQMIDKRNFGRNSKSALTISYHAQIVRMIIRSGDKSVCRSLSLYQAQGITDDELMSVVKGMVKELHNGKQT